MVEKEGMKEKYQHIFFDLDHTLWDFEANSRLTLDDLYKQHSLENLLKTSSEKFYSTYVEVNDQKWELYRQGKITKDRLRIERFHDTFFTFGLNDEEFSKMFEQQYLSLCPHQTQLLPGSVELLDYLNERYHLHIITNGFSETQNTKIVKSGLQPYFREVVSSEIIGVNKPSPEIFEVSMTKAGASAHDSLMVGDNLQADIIGARQCGMDQVFYNPLRLPHQEKITFEIAHLLEMKEFL